VSAFRRTVTVRLKPDTTYETRAVPATSNQHSNQQLFMRTDGYAPIEDYALIGDGRTAALVARDGAIDWLCLPNLDSPSVFGAILDGRRGGRFELQPTIPFDATRRYLPRTNVLETTFTTAGGSVRVVDAMTLPNHHLAPMRELVRSIEGVSGSVPMRWRGAPRFNYGAKLPRCEWRHGVPVATWRTEAIAFANWGAGAPAWRDGSRDGDTAPAVEAEFVMSAGSRALLAMATAYGEPLVLPGPQAIASRLADTIAFWEQWSASRRYDGPWADLVARSALVLKLMIFAPSGASVAAPTTSLPEEIGGARNWDYRYAWPRDASIGVGAFLGAGDTEAARSFFMWLLHATRLDRPRIPPVLTLDGRRVPAERELTNWPGYGDSRPVRFGNAAGGQRQLDVYGWVLDAGWLLTRAGHSLYAETWRSLASSADLVATRWRDPDDGIWEEREQPTHHVHSKLMAWLALDRAMRISAGRRTPTRKRRRWAQARDALAADVLANGFDDRRNTFVRAFGSDELDAAVLILPLLGFEPVGSPRVTGTIRAIRRELDAGNGLLYRYPPRSDGLPGGEGAFLPCSFWLVQALAATGQQEEAAELLDQLLALGGPLGLFAEEIDPRTLTQLGNFPQALTHAALVQAVLAMRDVTKAGAALPAQRHTRHARGE
jgi:GH15 family glucan-1,4-alpha-glucosidase